MKKNVWKENYEAPLIEWLDVAVEAGFLASNETGGTTSPFENGGSNDEEWDDTL